MKPYTQKAYEDRTNLHIVPALGAIKLTSLTAPMVQKFINSLSSATRKRKALAPKTIKNIHGVLHKALDQAVILDYLNSNPADHCTAQYNELFICELETIINHCIIKWLINKPIN